MADRGTIRRLAAIVSADVAGYSRLMGGDEEGTLAALKSHRRELIDPKIEEHHGRIVKTTGDGILIEFPSVVDALHCCLGVQQEMLERNKSVSKERRIQFRVGINLGDIIIDGDDIFGDGVNIAARLEAMAAPGGICVSRAVIEQVKQKLRLETEDLGERALKNIDEPVHAYRIAHGGSLQGPGEPTPEVTAAGQTGSSLPGRPSIAIMPFRNLNEDAESDYIADGIGLGIQTLLVQLSGLFLINASSDQDYRDGRKTASEAVQELPVRYTLEGAAQRASQRVRVSVHLTDLRNNTVVWAERYDRDLEDVFVLQDDITREVVSSLNIELFRRDFERIVTRDLSASGSWEYFLRGVSHIYKFNKDDNERARQMFEKLYALNPNKVHGPGYIALTHWIDATRGWVDSPTDSLTQAAEWATKAIQYVDNDGLGHVIMSYVRIHEGQHEEALALCEKAIEYRANCPAALGQIATVRLYCGDARGAIKSAREALNVRTMHPPLLINLLATAYRDSGEVGLSIPTAQEAARLDPLHTDALATLCSGYVLAGNDDEAYRVAQDIVSIDPAFRISDFATKHPYKDKSKRVYLAETLRSAGLPE
jgi:adenylate cyclase